MHVVIFKQRLMKNEFDDGHIAQTIAETYQKYFQSFIATEIFSEHFFQILQNISSQH